MATPTKHTMLNKIEGLDTFYNGGKGSGNFGHSGRPGKVGGSSSDGEHFGTFSSDKVDEAAKTFIWLKATDHGNAKDMASHYRAKVRETQKEIDDIESGKPLSVMTFEGYRNPYTSSGRLAKDARIRLSVLKEQKEKDKMWADYWTDAAELMRAGYYPSADGSGKTIKLMHRTK